MSAEKSIKEGILGSGRLDQALSACLPDISRERVKALILDGALTIDNQIVKSASNKKYEGKSFTLTIPKPTTDKSIAQDIPLTVVFEDEHLIIIDKPAGLVVHPSAGHDDGTLVNALLHHCKGQLSGIGGVERPGIVHRIDKDTSGLIVAAKNDKTHAGLAALFAAHDIDRQYLAIVSGRPKQSMGTIETQIGRSLNNRKKMDVLDEGRGKHAITHYRVEEYLNGSALVRCTLETGRTHQIRVHMKYIGHPLVGDQTYNVRRKQHNRRPIYSNFDRQALHASILGFIHPITEEKLWFESNLPDDMQLLLRNERL